MRSDMYHVIVMGTGRTKKKSAVRNCFRAAKHFKLDDENEVFDEYCGSSIRLKQHYVGCFCCDPGLNLKPLHRYLKSQVGRRWNDVFAD
ncbi:MAG: hypothetical protein NTX56_18885, partial [Proteobacteria bacterium]|nr:hypothetical protein [Pseudomonadota bacterium]